MQIDAVEDQNLRALVGVLPFFHIYGMVVVMNFGLRRGATCVTLPRFDLELFLRVLQDWPITLAHIVPPIAVALAKHPVVDNYDLSGVRWLFSGAAPLGPQLTEAVETRLNVRVRQGYGMTEASPATHYTVPGARPSRQDRSPHALHRGPHRRSARPARICPPGCRARSGCAVRR